MPVNQTYANIIRCYMKKKEMNDLSLSLSLSHTHTASSDRDFHIASIVVNLITRPLNIDWVIIWKYHAL